jgi:ABC-2 type transport system permease protein
VQGLLKLTWVETKLFLRDLAGTFFSLAFPLLLLVIYGSVYTNEPNAFFGGHGILDFYVPAYFTIVIATNGLLALPVALASYREKGVLLRLRATPLRPQAILATEVMVNFLMTAAGTLLLIVVGFFVYHVNFLGNPLSMLAAFVLSCLSIFTLGFVIASLVPSARTAEFVSFAIYFPMLFLSGATFPVKIFPPALQQVVQFLPLTQVVNLLQGLWLGDSWSDLITPVIVLISIVVVGVIISARLFRWR